MALISKKLGSTANIAVNASSVAEAAEEHLGIGPIVSVTAAAVTRIRVALLTREISQVEIQKRAASMMIISWTRA